MTTTATADDIFSRGSKCRVVAFKSGRAKGQSWKVNAAFKIKLLKLEPTPGFEPGTFSLPSSLWTLPNSN
jgi:hypothetical protein